MVTSWFWLVGAVCAFAAAADGQEHPRRHRGSGDNLSRHLFDLDRGRLGTRGLAGGGRIILLPTLIGAVLLGLFAIDLGWSLWGVAPPATPQGIGDIFSSGRGIHMAIDLAGLAIAGGLFIVPTFSAVQAWAGADRRARVVAGVNVLNAAFMAVSALAGRRCCKNSA